jgi:hypothetical protein
MDAVVMTFYAHVSAPGPYLPEFVIACQGKTLLNYPDVKETRSDILYIDDNNPQWRQIHLK